MDTKDKMRGEIRMNTSKELQNAVEAYSSGKEESFNQIYELSYKYLHTCVVHVVRDEDVAMDMLQETYLEISKSISQLKNTEGFLGWAATIANRKCFAYLKKQKEIILSANADEDEADDYFENIADREEFIPETILQDQEKQRLIREILGELTELQRLCVVGFYYNEQKQEEIAQELGIPVNTVKSHLNRAKVKVKEAVVELDEKKGTRLYSMAPFMLLFLGAEADACEVVPMNQLLGAVDEAAAGATVNEKIGAEVVKKAGMALKTKIVVGTAIVGTIAVVGTLGYVLQNHNQPVSNEIVEQPIELEEHLEPDGEIEAEQIEENVEEQIEVQNEEVQEQAEEITVSTNSTDALPISGLYDNYRFCNRGLIPVEKDGKCGLVTCDNQVVVPLEYESGCYMVNKEGQSFFKKGERYYIFDQNGNEICNIDTKGLTVKSINDGVVFATNGDGFDTNFAYYSIDGGVIYESDVEQGGDKGATAFNEGYAFCVDNDYIMRLEPDGDYVTMEQLLEELKAKKQKPSGGGSMTSSVVLMEVPIGAPIDGFYFNRAYAGSLDSAGHYMLRSVDGENVYTWDMSSIYNKEGLSYYYSDIPAKFRLHWIDGTSYYHYGTIICAFLDKGDVKSHYLIDMSKLKVNEADLPYMKEDEYVDADKYILTDEALIATGEYIGLNREKYWLIQKNGKWGYIDHDGNMIATYEDATDFYDGNALIVEEGKAYLIDENLEKVREIGLAQGVTNCGEIFRVQTENGEMMVMP